MAKGIRILTAAVGTRKDLREELQMAARGQIRTIFESVTLDEINDVFQRMETGRIMGRAVVEFP